MRSCERSSKANRCLNGMKLLMESTEVTVATADKAEVSVAEAEEEAAAAAAALADAAAVTDMADDGNHSSICFGVSACGSVQAYGVWKMGSRRSLTACTWSLKQSCLSLLSLLLGSGISMSKLSMVTRLQQQMDVYRYRSLVRRSKAVE
jgi:hypothetical protein